jgi:hypothetical protein
MRFLSNIAAAILLACAACAACIAEAADNTLLIQLQKDGSYLVWHSEGRTQLSDDELTSLSASARPEGGEPILTTAGPASAFEIPRAVLVVLADAKSDRKLLIDRDACGGVRLWHAEGATSLTDDQLTELVLSALPDGGKRVSIGSNYAKAYSTELGVVAVIWAPVERPKPR